MLTYASRNNSLLIILFYFCVFARDFLLINILFFKLKSPLFLIEGIINIFLLIIINNNGLSLFKIDSISTLENISNKKELFL